MSRRTKLVQIRSKVLKTVENLHVFHSDSIIGFIPRREIRSISSRGPIEVSFHLLNFGLERVYWTSKTYRVYRVFFARKCFIVTGGRVDGLDGLDG